MTHRAANRAFTLVELMVVIAIIALLVTLTLGVASSVAEAGRKRATEGVLRALDQTLDIYIESRGQNPPAWVQVTVPDSGGPNLGDNIRYLPIADAVGRRSGATSPFEPLYSAAFYLAEAERLPAVQSVINNIDARFVRVVRIGDVDQSGDIQQATDVLELRNVVDAWGNHIRMVHPRFDGTIRGTGEFETVGLLRLQDNPYVSYAELGAGNPSQVQNRMVYRQIRRIAPGRDQWRQYTPQQIEQEFFNNAGDADGGICPSPRPYFYSAGPDGDPSTIDDNVYLTRPRFPEETN